MEQLLALKRQPLEVVAAALAPQFPSLDKEWIENTSRDLINTADGPFLTMMTGEIGTGKQGRVEWSTLLARITTPTLVLAADPASGSWMGEEQRNLVRDTLPSVQSLDFSGCGHHIESYMH